MLCERWRRGKRRWAKFADLQEARSAASSDERRNEHRGDPNEEVESPQCRQDRNLRLTGGSRRQERDRARAAVQRWILRLGACPSRQERGWQDSHAYKGPTPVAIRGPGGQRCEEGTTYRALRSVIRGEDAAPN